MAKYSGTQSIPVACHFTIFLLQHYVKRDQNTNDTDFLDSPCRKFVMSTL